LAIEIAAVSELQLNLYLSVFSRLCFNKGRLAVCLSICHGCTVAKWCEIWSRLLL